MVTNQRLYIRRGILSKKVQQTRIDRVQNVNTDQRFRDRLLRVGTVDFDTAGTDDPGDDIEYGELGPLLRTRMAQLEAVHQRQVARLHQLGQDPVHRGAGQVVAARQLLAVEGTRARHVGPADVGQQPYRHQRVVLAAETGEDDAEAVVADRDVAGPITGRESRARLRLRSGGARS